MNDRRFRLWGIPVLALLIALLNGPYAGADAAARFVVSWGVSLYFTAALWVGSRALWAWLLRRLPRVEQTGRRLWALAGLSVAFVAGATVLLMLPLHWLFPAWFPLEPASLLRQMRFNLLPTAVVQTLYEALYFFQQWEANARRADQLARASTQAQLDALHSQLDPHFLFNNLNTLAALIEPGNAPAQQFVEQLADVYRYVLLAQGQPTVPLAEEIAFVETYLALHKVRFRDNLVVEMSIAPAALARRVAPLSVQLLVENALKHNEASRQHPLHLRLTVAAGQPDVLVVENTLRPRTAGLAPGTGTGLANVRRRYELLHAAQPVEVTQADGQFRVKLPLL
ncbi:sensor histidine kinase [Hymenobacter antarcticus]|uniref:Signal transduction histidine kinase internal region domain-containing protein n=1 Tax=Hymenobacter antarcticus TaxID=486270 RepID=A0ABP7PFH4_9BACT